MDTNGKRVGCSHIVKVVAYSTAHCGGSCRSGAIDELLPWIETKTSGFLSSNRSFTLKDRDGYVYVNVKRWDQSHSNSILFPNGRPLWQFLFQNPKITGASGQGLPGACQGLPVPGSSSFVGWGLAPQTLTGLAFNNQLLPQDATALSQAFMLNDEGNGSVDPSASSNAYKGCLSTVNVLLANAPDSYACAEYIASGPGPSVTSGRSGDGDQDYSVKFVDCNTLPGGVPPDDLTGG